MAIKRIPALVEAENNYFIARYKNTPEYMFGTGYTVLEAIADLNSLRRTILKFKDEDDYPLPTRRRLLRGI